MRRQGEALNQADVIIVGAGIGGLAAAVDLAQAGLGVTVVDEAAAPGGKLRQLDVAGVQVDSGPTVLTMKWVFDELFAAAGARFEACVDVTQGRGAGPSRLE